jgi:hypothetical protein
MQSPRAIRAVDMRLIEDLFGMGGGYVLDFSNRTFADFFKDELDANIDDPRYDAEGTSKAKRLRLFLRTAESQIRIRTLLALWEYRESSRRGNRIAESIPNAEEEFYCLIERLGGTRLSTKERARATQVETKIDHSVIEALKGKLVVVGQLQPVERGYAYERFLKDLFDANGLAARASFRLVGEQIDGSFELAAETYLLEAKWTNLPIGVAELRFAWTGWIYMKC